MAGLFLVVCNNLGEAEAGPSPISIAADRTTFDIMEDGTATTTLTLENADIRYRTMDVYLVANWPTGIAWSVAFMDTNYDELDGNLVQLNGNNSSTTVLFSIYCDSVCSAGDINTVQVLAITDPKFYNDDGNITDTCGSDDCETDSTPASASSNITNVISMTLASWSGYAFSLSCDAESSEGGNVVTSGNVTRWAYALENVGWNTDTYQFTSVVTSVNGHNVNYWIIASGMLNGKELTGQSDNSSTAVHTAESSISITPATNATSGIYNVGLTVISSNGAPDSGSTVSFCAFDVIVPGSETEEETTGDPANETVEEETAEKETEDEIEEEVPSISLITALISIGIIAVFRRK